MYVGRTLNELQDVPYEKWTLEELAYHQDTMNQLKRCLNAAGQTILQKVLAEIESRGGIPVYGGDYDHPSTLHYD
ncbi:hypothetical protein EV586_105201 [Tumebacillus sp. BK434]|uniref:hypothetical protein n=1 Tax=Tumebacillus sp. BK434 TaxID=2512169 RepID=UPI00104FB8AE|nr:hypothetical protein [Tumebacillus sp. BK434]TCP53856.1 hypothetical protein EV586_105201 [Tumebacillus sp. BK434]